MTMYGMFEHIRIAQGLCDAPATFQRVMHLALWSKVLVYLDDVIVLGKSFEVSLENLVHNLKLKPKSAPCLALRYASSAIKYL